ncbi:polysaccharide deacetylase family protein [Halalkalibacter sp. MEB205]|uniref:Polysaccharide deacetylase family protein n=1 Tax=Halalkalibacter alkaliphilus TaxID=2917993 RepID=A0A9X2CVP0_9BACI|nr:polysaccharide deacetylase family protein [Halalkalibacter alkaliphilus]
MKEMGFRATIYTIVDRTENGWSRRLTYDQMREMVQSGVINIQSHTYDQHHSIQGANGRTGAALITKVPTAIRAVAINKS